MPTESRRLGVQILLDVDGRGPTLGDRLAAPDVEALPPRDRAFLHELVLGTLRRRGAIDAALAPLSTKPLSELDAPVRAILRLAAHQIVHLRVPDRAAVSEAVDLAKERAPRGSGFVNAVLRRLAREGPPAEPDPAREPLAWLTTAGSLPGWLAERWLGRLGAEAAVLRARALAAAPATTVRLNPRHPDAEARALAAGLALLPLTVPGALRVTAGRAHELASAGLLLAQDEGSQLVAHLAAAPGRTLDACAAPGGKATLVADLVGRDGLVFAGEIAPARLRTLAALTARWGAPNVRVLAADGLRPPYLGGFDTVLLDAPCSGLGTIARHPDIRWRVAPADLARHARRQAGLLDSLAQVVRPGGRLVYATCSSEPEENDDVVARFLERRRDFRVLPLPRWAESFGDGPYARTRPEVDGGDAFFAVLLGRA
ncbi:MAG: transcription antitermination factor NusB [Vicinamibacteria bacterium]